MSEQSTAPAAAATTAVAPSIAAAAGAAAAPATAPAATAAAASSAAAPAHGAPTEGTQPAPGAAPAPAQVGEVKPAAAPVVPEKYTLKIPDGVKVDPERLTAFEAFAKANQYTQEQAQATMDHFVKSEADAQGRFAEVKAGWLESAKKDAEFGGDKLREAVAVAKRALARFGSPELDKLLNDTGLGNHPEIIRAFWRAGMKISPDDMVTGKPAGGTPSASDAASALYPSQGRKAA